jgi:hypothetical protein
MEFYSNRFKSFTNGDIKWPHKIKGWRATPETLAKAGFYFDPEEDDVDSTTCYMCKKTLCGWEKTDDPLTEHSRDKKCPLIILYRKLSSDRVLERNRLMTFNFFDHFLNKNLAKNGFIYYPEDENHKEIKCSGCDLTFKNWWEMEEHSIVEIHSKKSPKCQFSCKKIKKKKTKIKNEETDNRENSSKLCKKEEENVKESEIIDEEILEKSSNENVVLMKENVLSIQSFQQLIPSFPIQDEDLNLTVEEFMKKIQKKEVERLITSTNASINELILKYKEKMENIKKRINIVE